MQWFLFTRQECDPRMRSFDDVKLGPRSGPRGSRPGHHLLHPLSFIRVLGIDCDSLSAMDDA